VLIEDVEKGYHYRMDRIANATSGGSTLKKAAAVCLGWSKAMWTKPPKTRWFHLKEVMIERIKPLNIPGRFMLHEFWPCLTIILLFQ